MTAQRTTLLSLCLLLVTLVFGLNGETPEVELLATNIRVDYQYAVAVLMLLVTVGTVSYLWRFRAESHSVQYQQALAAVSTLRGEIAEELGSRVLLECTDELRKIVGSEDIGAAQNKLMDDLYRYEKNLKARFERIADIVNRIGKSFAFKEKQGNIRDQLFDYYMPGVIGLGAALSGIFRLLGVF